MRTLIRRPWVLPVVVGLIAFVARWISVASVGGLPALLGYDEGVYMGAAVALSHGLIPYRDFTLVHPPGSTVLLLPFAWLSRFTSEPTGWATARVAVMLLGAVNAAMVTVVARRISLAAAAAAGLLYAVWGPVIHVERTTMLEAFVLTGLLVALVAFRNPRDSLARAVIAGAALGLGTSVKLWGALPLIVIVVWLVASKAWRQAGVVVAASVIAFSAVVGPFLLVVGERMVQLVILAQLGRGDGGTPLVERPARMLAMDAFPTTAPRAAWFAAVLIVVIATVVAWRRKRARLWVAMLACQGAALLLVPVYFAGYSSFIGPALALVVAAAVDVALRDSRPGAARAIASSGAVAVVGTLGFLGVTHIVNDGDSLSGPDARVAVLVANARCVTGDSTGVLLMYNVLGRSIDTGCRPLIDVDGTVYAENQDNPGRLTSTARRHGSERYQQDLANYFARGDLVLMHRAHADALDAQGKSALSEKGVALHTTGLRVYGFRN